MGGLRGSPSPGLPGRWTRNPAYGAAHRARGPSVRSVGPRWETKASWGDPGNQGADPSGGPEDPALAHDGETRGAARERPRDETEGGPLRPVFIVGCPRSGTTVLQNVLRLHPEMAWVTPATNAMTGFFTDRGLDPAPAFPLSRVLDPLSRHLPRELLPHFLEGPEDGDLRDGLPNTQEGSRIWIRSVPDRDHERLTADDVEPGAREHYQRVVRLHQEYFDASRFLSKFPVNVLRVPWLNELFPQGHFIHILRDGRAAAASIAQRRRSGGGNPREGWFGPRPPGWQDLEGQPVPKQAGWLWRTTVDCVESDAEELLPPERFTRVRYEELADEPEATVERVLEATDLEGEEAMEAIRPYLENVENRNWKWRERFSDEDLEILMEEIRDDMVRYGYLDG